MTRRYHAAMFIVMLNIDVYVLHCRWPWWCERMNAHQNACELLCAPDIADVWRS